MFDTPGRDPLVRLSVADGMSPAEALAPISPGSRNDPFVTALNAAASSYAFDWKYLINALDADALKPLATSRTNFESVSC